MNDRHSSRDALEIEQALDYQLRSGRSAPDFEALMQAAFRALALEGGRAQVPFAVVPPSLGAPSYVPPQDLARVYAEQSRDYHVVVARAREPEAEAKTKTDLEHLSGLSIAALNALRRRLAATHHPDLAPAALRAEANGRMSRINELIDQAMGEAEGRRPAP